MPKENDLEGPQDQGGKHGGQAGMPRRSPTAADQGIVRDERGQEQPRNKERAQKSAAKTRGTIPRARSANPMRLCGSSRAVSTRTTPRCLRRVCPWIEA
jgi:hypothetical protein